MTSKSGSMRPRHEIAAGEAAICKAGVAVGVAGRSSMAANTAKRPRPITTVTIHFQRDLLGEFIPGVGNLLSSRCKVFVVLFYYLDA